MAFDETGHQHLVGETIIERGAVEQSSSADPVSTIRPSRTATCVAKGRVGFIVMILRAAKTTVPDVTLRLP
nr:hypothetical protein [Rhodopseudomonas sp. B29]